MEKNLNDFGRMMVAALPACKGGWTLYQTEEGAIRAIKTAALEAGWDKNLYSLPVQGAK